MRFRSLSLVAFGPFTGHELDLAGGAPGGLHIVFGPNEAGKSTALRAVRDLLFGIPERTGDAHLHPMQELRLAAVLENGQSERLVIQRLKRRKDSLRDASDAPIDEARLAKFMNGVDSSMFERVFGLDHVRLKEAGQALLANKGDLGESLFDAGFGGRAVGNVRDELRRELAELFRPNAKTARLNQLVGKYKETKTATRDATYAPEAYRAQRERLDEKAGELAKLRENRRTLSEEKERLQRLSSALVKIGQRAERLREREALGQIPNLPDDAASRRAEAQRVLSDTARDLIRLEREILRYEERLSDLVVPEGLLEVGEEQIEALRDTVGKVRAAARDLPKREAELKACEDDARSILERLGLGNDLVAAERMRLKVTDQARLRRLSQLRHSLTSEGQTCRTRLDEQRLGLEVSLRKLGALPPEADLSLLERVARDAKTAGDLEGRSREVSREVESLSRRIAQRLAALGLWSGTIEECLELAAPGAETIERFDAELHKLANERDTLHANLEAKRQRAAEVKAQIEAMLRAGQVPTEAELAKLRKVRDLALEQALALWQSGKPSQVIAEVNATRSLHEVIPELVESADQIADRLRREAQRVSELSTLTAELLHLEDAIEQLNGKLSALEQKLDAAHAEWKKLWAALKIKPLSPTEMRAWLLRFREIAALAEQLDEAKAKSRALESERGKLCDQARRALGLTSSEESLALLIERCELELRRLNELARDRRQLRENQREFEVRVELAERALQEHEQKLIAWREEWEQALSPLGMPASAEPEEVNVVLDEAVELFKKLDEQKDLTRRIEGIRRDRRDFERSVQALVEQHAPDLKTLAPDTAAEQLNLRFRHAVRDRDERKRLERELNELKSERDAVLTKQKDAEWVLSELTRSIGVQSADELEQSERVFAKARALDEELARLDADLLEVAGGAPLESLIEQARGTDRATLSARLSELEEQLEQLEEQLNDLGREIGSLEKGLELYGDTNAADLAQEQAALAAEIREATRRYAKLRLADLVLSREIERYREQHQGPILRRAATLFSELTLEGYRTLRVGLQDQTIRCVRADDKEIEVSELSEGTTYQLYLALRLASLERYLEHNEPLPLVLDDILIHFDDARKTAAFRVLGEFAARIQILFFTHHVHELELARECVPKGRLYEHSLKPRSYVAGAVQA